MLRGSARLGAGLRKRPKLGARVARNPVPKWALKTRNRPTSGTTADAISHEQRQVLRLRAPNLLRKKQRRRRQFSSSEPGAPNLE